MLAIPIETAVREFDYKLMLAVSSLPWAGASVIGRLDAIVGLARHVDELTFVGKLFEPTFPDASLHRLEPIRAAGWRVVYLDEEGAFFPEDIGAALDRRLIPDVLDEDDVVCCWGKVQAEHYASVTGPGGPRAVTVGHPRFDLLSAEFAPYYEGEVRSLQERLGPYYLVNTSFSPGNHGSSAFGRFGPKPNFRDDSVEDVLEWVDSTRAITEIHRSVAQLSRRHPDVRFVVRPHPSEHLSGYDALRGLPNVIVERTGSVIPWILGSRGMIHGGCTTAVEGLLGDRPVVSLELDLPGLTGTLDVLHGLGETYAEDVLTRIEETDAYPAHRAVPRELADLIDNFNEPSFARVMGLVRTEAERLPSPDRDRLRRGVKLAGYASGLAWMGSDIRRRLSPDRGRHFHYSASKFPGFRPLDLHGRLERAASFLGVPARVGFLSRDLALIESA